METERRSPHGGASRWRGRLAVLVAGLALGLGACAGGPTVRTNYAANTDFLGYRTFAIRAGEIVNQASTPELSVETTDRQYVEEAIRANMQAKGLSESSTSPDLYVTYVLGAKTRKEWENLGPAVYTRYGFLWGPEMWDLGYEDWWVEHDVTQGTLVIDLVDAKTKQTVWRSIAEEDLRHPVTEETIANAVTEAMKDFPPKQTR